MAEKPVACMTTGFWNNCDILTLTNKHKGGCAMYGAILGDIIGSPYEFDMGDKTKDFPLFNSRSYFTDDSVMTIAVAEALMDSLKSRLRWSIQCRNGDIVIRVPVMVCVFMTGWRKKTRSLMEALETARR